MIITTLTMKQKASYYLPSTAEDVRAMKKGRQGAMRAQKMHVWTPVGAQQVISKSFLEAEAPQPLEECWKGKHPRAPLTSPATPRHPEKRTQLGLPLENSPARMLVTEPQ